MRSPLLDILNEVGLDAAVGARSDENQVVKQAPARSAWLALTFPSEKHDFVHEGTCEVVRPDQVSVFDRICATSYMVEHHFSFFVQV